jgi:hypothetical protein
MAKDFDVVSPTALAFADRDPIAWRSARQGGRDGVLSRVAELDSGNRLTICHFHEHRSGREEGSVTMGKRPVGWGKSKASNN